MTTNELLEVQSITNRIGSDTQCYTNFRNRVEPPCNSPVDFIRTLRDLLAPSISAHISPATTPAPPPPWTTVFSDYGPIGVSNPKALVSKDTSLHNATIVVTHAIGPSDTWRSPESHNYTTYIVSHVQPFRLPNYKDMCWETQIGQ
ncbi:hypothetical protein ANCDUO_21490, partial [Ancylostoma duodenale]